MERKMDQLARLNVTKYLGIVQVNSHKAISFRGYPIESLQIPQ